MHAQMTVSPSPMLQNVASTFDIPPNRLDNSHPRFVELPCGDWRTRTHTTPVSTCAGSAFNPNPQNLASP
jgi:hypothetical protein